MTVQQIAHSALALSVADRGHLAQQLLESLEPGCDVARADVDATWCAEVERRREAIRSGETTLLPWEEARAQLRQNLEQRRVQ
jgi:putative addiction module component (TIGR02574 family)